MKAWIRDGSLSPISLECVRGFSADQNISDAIAHKSWTLRRIDDLCQA